MRQKLNDLQDSLIVGFQSDLALVIQRGWNQDEVLGCCS